jgi:hypothetical protein
MAGYLLVVRLEDIPRKDYPIDRAITWLLQR